MPKLILIKHHKGAPGLRYFGLGPNFLPCQGLIKLKNFLDQNTAWAKDRQLIDLKLCQAKNLINPIAHFQHPKSNRVNRI